MNEGRDGSSETVGRVRRESPRQTALFVSNGNLLTSFRALVDGRNYAPVKEKRMSESRLVEDVKAEFRGLNRDAIADEAQRRMDVVVDAAVEWRFSDLSVDEENGAYAMCDKLEVAIDSLLELRGKPSTSGVSGKPELGTIARDQGRSADYIRGYEKAREDAVKACADLEGEGDAPTDRLIGYRDCAEAIRALIPNPITQPDPSAKQRLGTSNVTAHGPASETES